MRRRIAIPPPRPARISAPIHAIRVTFGMAHYAARTAIHIITAQTSPHVAAATTHPSRRAKRQIPGKRATAAIILARITRRMIARLTIIAIQAPPVLPACLTHLSKIVRLTQERLVIKGPNIVRITPVRIARHQNPAMSAPFARQQPPAPTPLILIMTATALIRRLNRPILFAGRPRRAVTPPNIATAHLLIARVIRITVEAAVPTMAAVPADVTPMKCITAVLVAPVPVQRIPLVLPLQDQVLAVPHHAQMARE